MQAILLTDSVRVFGHWHVLGHEDDVLAGELTYEPETGVRLEVVGHFGGLPRGLRASDDTVDPHNVVLGRTKNQDVTLYGCDQINTTISIPGQGSTTYRSSFALFGAHDDSDGPLVADAVTARIPVLDAWLPMTGLSYEITGGEGGNRVTGWSQRYQNVDPLDIELSWGTIRIVPSATFSGAATLANRQSSMREWLNLEFTFGEPIDVKEVLNERVGPLVDLANLLTSYPAALTYFALRAPVINVQGESAEQRQVLDVLFHQGWVVAPSTKIESHRYLLSPAADVVPPIAELVGRWYASRDHYRRAMDMLFGMERSPRGTYTEVRFLTLCHAAEALHRDQPLEQTRYSDAEYKRLQRTALDAMTDKAAQTFLKEQFRYANQLSLRERLSALRDLALGNDSDLITDQTIGRIVKARNNLTHSSTRDLRRLEDSGSLYYLSQYVAWLLRACFLVELGLDRDQIVELLTESDQFSWLRRTFSST